MRQANRRFCVLVVVAAFVLLAAGAVICRPATMDDRVRQGDLSALMEEPKMVPVSTNTAFPKAPAPAAEPGVVTLRDDEGNIVNFDVPPRISAFLARWGGLLALLAFVSRIILKFLPAAKSGTINAWIVWLLKHLSFSMPQKHQADIKMQLPTPNGLPTGAVIAPPVPQPPVTVNSKTDNGLP